MKHSNIRTLSLFILIIFCPFEHYSQVQTSKALKIVPLVADREDVVSSGNGHFQDTIIKAKFFRDMRGRTRTEFGNKIVISDPVLKQSYALNTDSKTAVISDFSQANRSSVSNPKAQAPPAKVTKRSLGKKLIEGILCEGEEMASTYSFTLHNGVNETIEMKSETWFSEKLVMPLVTNNYNSKQGRHLQIYKNIKVGTNPDTSFFQIPKEYRIIR